KERILDWKGKKEIIERFLKSFRYKGISLKDIEQSIEGKPKGEAKEEELNLFWQSLDTIIYDDIKKLTRGQLDFLLNEENTKILKLRVKNRQEGKIGAERKKIQKQIENLTHPETRESSPEYQKPYLNLIQDRLDEHVLSKKVEHIKQKIAKHIEILEAAAEEYSEQEKLNFIEEQLIHIDSFFNKFLGDTEILTKKERFYIKGHLIKNIRSKIESGKLNEAIDTLKKVYEDLKQSLKKGHQGAHKKMEKKLIEDFGGYEMDFHEEIILLSVEELEEGQIMTEEDVRELLAKGMASNVADDYTLSFAEKLNGIKAYELKILLSELSEEKEKIVYDEVTGEYKPITDVYKRNIIRIKKELKKLLLDFRGEKYTAKYYIEKLSGDIADVEDKYHLKSAAGFREDILKEKSDSVIKEIRNIKRKEDAKKYLQDSKDEADKYLERRAYPEERLERLRNNKGSFDIFRTVREYLIYENEIEKKDEAQIVSKKEKKLSEIEEELTEAQEEAASLEEEAKAGIDVREIKEELKASEKRIAAAQKAKKEAENELKKARILEEADREKEAGYQNINDVLEKIRTGIKFEYPYQARETMQVLAYTGRLKEHETEIRKAIKNIPEPERRHFTEAQHQEQLRQVPEEKRKLGQELDGYLWPARKTEPISPGEEKPKDADNNPYIKGEKLEKIRQELSKLREISHRKFSGKNDFEEFDSIHQIIDKLAEDEYFFNREELTDEKGLYILYGGQQIYRNKKDKKQLPLEEQMDLEGLEYERNNLKRYEKTIKVLGAAKGNEILGKLDDEKTLMKALTSLYGDFYEVAENNAGEAQKLSKVMSIDHPMTALRFNAAKKYPFTRTDGKFQFHRLQGKPATFKDRAVSLIKRARDAVDGGDFMALEKLFSFGEQGDRLYMDSVFFPINQLQTHVAVIPGKDRETLTHRIVWNKEKTEYKKVLSPKIPPELEDLFEGEKLKKDDEKYQKDNELEKLPASPLIEDENFQKAFGIISEEKNRKSLEERESHLQYDEEGNLIPDEEFLEELKKRLENGEVIKGMGIIGRPGEITIERLKEIAKEYPNYANYAAITNSELAGATMAGAAAVGRKIYDVAAYPFRYSSVAKELYWKDIQIMTPMSFIRAIDQGIEHIRNIAEFRTQYAALKLLKGVFSGTVVGSEFAKLLQAKQDERVNQFRESFKNFGHDDIKEKLYAARDEFELKAACFEGFENRGIFAVEDFLDIRFIRNMNKYTPTVRIPTNFTQTEMLEDPEIKQLVLSKIREGMDETWGQGSWQGWTNQNVAKFDSWKDQQKKVVEGWNGKERIRVYEQYWELLRTQDGIAKLKKRHPAELMANVEMEMMHGWNDWGDTAMILQALVCKGLIRQEQLNRLQNLHINDLPIYSIMEPMQAKLCGMEEHIQNALDSNCKYGIGKGNPVNDYYQGFKALKLTGYRDEGKWTFCKTKADFEEKKSAGKIQDAAVTVHQVAKYRESQPKWHREMDNSAIHVFSPSYPFYQIENALQPDT
ncbi:MAG TPA: hypothetical protein VJ142_03220, partial [Candidatus Nanoarchaeia archaeon]|nr:hypothetical protein [Candidatus Nanoarchaeia archaeon]